MPRTPLNNVGRVSSLAAVLAGYCGVLADGECGYRQASAGCRAGSGPGWRSGRIWQASGCGLAAWSGKDRGPGVAGQPGLDQGPQVDGAAPVMQPGVVLGGADVTEPDAAAILGSGPGDDPFDHRPGRIGALELVGAGLRAGGAQQPLVRVDGHRPAVFGGGAARPERAPGTQLPEGDGPLAAHQPGMPGRAGHRALLLVDDEVVQGEPAGHRRAQRPGLDHRVVPGLAVVSAGLAGAVGRVTIDLQSLLLPRPSVPSESSAASTPSPATSASTPTAPAAASSRSGEAGPASSASTASASFTRSLTRSCLACGSSQSISGLPGLL